MPVFEQIWDEKTRLNKQKKELKRLEESFVNLDESSRRNVDGLINAASFQRVAIEELQLIIQRDGYVDEYKNGENQFGVKKSAAVETYDKMVNTYSKIIKQLCDLLPDESSVDAGAELMDFVNSR